MDINAVICEYNPFHTGHAMHIAKTRDISPGAVVCIMSGSFVQRGEPAILSKYARAEMAVRAGADLVIELPHAFAMSSAQRFAQAGVELAGLIGAKVLSFGAECADADALTNAALLYKRDDVNEAIKKCLSSGMDYPAALTAAFKEADPRSAALLRSANNTLAIEYIRAMEKYPDMRPLSIERIGAGHDSGFSDATASASFIRKILTARGSAREFMPDTSLEIYRRELDRGRAPVTAAALDRAVMAKLKCMSKEDFLLLPDVSEGLENRLFKAARSASSVSDFCGAVKTKRYTYSRIRRIAMAAYTCLEKKHQSALPSYIRVLALGSGGRRILSQLGNVNIITKPSAAVLCGSDRALFELECRCDELWALGCPEAADFNAMQQSPIYVNM